MTMQMLFAGSIATLGIIFLTTSPTLAFQDDDIKVETLQAVECERSARKNDFVTLHFMSKWQDEEDVIHST